MKRNRKLKMLVGLLALTLIVGSLAFFSKDMSIDNPFSTLKYGGETIEKFTPENAWEPGGQVTKEVQAKNTGDYPLYVRVKFDEKWEREGQLIAGTELSSEDDELFFPASADNKIIGGSSVYKNLVGVSQYWTKGTDGYYYYNTELIPDDTTELLMDSVTLCKDADMGTYTASAMKYALVDKDKTADELTDADYTLTEAPDKVPDGQVLYQKKVITLDSEHAGLAGANYTLTITTELLQANADAATESGWDFIPSSN